MHFLPDVYVPCEQCHGKRYNRETLDIRFKGKTIADVLDMPIEEAADFFAAVPAIARRGQDHATRDPPSRPGAPATEHVRRLRRYWLSSGRSLGLALHRATRRTGQSARSRECIYSDH